MLRKVRDPAVRFAAKVDRNGPIHPHRPELGPCHLWQGGKSLCGYGRFRPGRKAEGMVATHRWVLARKLGRPINPGHHACHSCDVRLCVNPDHVFEGTQQDNEDDKVAKGRTPRGVRHGSKTRPERVARGSRGGLAKLHETDVVRIKQLVTEEGAVASHVARQYGVTPTIISRILSKKIWRHVP